MISWDIRWAAVWYPHSSASWFKSPSASSLFFSFYVGGSLKLFWSHLLWALTNLSAVISSSKGSVWVHMMSFPLAVQTIFLNGDPWPMLCSFFELTRESIIKLTLCFRGRCIVVTTQGAESWPETASWHCFRTWQGKGQWTAAVVFTGFGKLGQEEEAECFWLVATHTFPLRQNRLAQRH